MVNELREAVSRQIKLQPGVSITYSGQLECLERANAGGTSDVADQTFPIVSFRSAATLHQNLRR